MRQPQTMQPTPDQAADRSDERIFAELQLVGSLLSLAGGKPYLPGDILAVCRPECMLSPVSRAGLAAIKAAADSGGTVDLVAVARELKRAEADHPRVKIADVVGLATTHDGLWTEGSVMEAARSIAAEWRKDKAAIELGRAQQVMREYSKPAEFAAESLRSALGILEHDGNDAPGLDKMLDRYVAELRTERKARPVPSPWANLNGILRGGILPGELGILAARPSVGKSALALNWAWSVACSGKKALFFSLEMTPQQLFDRMAANIGGIDVGAFRQGLTPIQRDNAIRAAESMRGSLLDIVEQPRMTIAEVRRRARIAQRGKTPVGLVVVDYLQLVMAEDSRAPREQQVAGMSRALKIMAKELDVPVLALAQLNRKAEETRRPPILSDLRESGAIEQDADIVIFLHQARAAWHSDEPVQVIVAKGRSSGVGRGDLIFRRKLQRFEDSTQAAFETARAEEERGYAEYGQHELE